jgi:hypothetical protein
MNTGIVSSSIHVIIAEYHRLQLHDSNLSQAKISGELFNSVFIHQHDLQNRQRRSIHHYTLVSPAALSKIGEQILTSQVFFADA